MNNTWCAKKKTMDYLLQKGFEPELVTGIVNGFGNKEGKDIQ